MQDILSEPSVSVPTEEELAFLRRNPSLFIEKFLGDSLWHKQVSVAEMLSTHKRVAVRSCHGSGKTFLAARLALWWLFTRRFSSVLTTAPSNRQVVELLWKEIRVAYANARVSLGGKLLPKAPKLTVADDWVLIGFSTDNPVNFQGWHSKGGTLVIFDEAPGVHSEIWEAVQGVLVSDNDRLLCIGNPVEPYGPFYDLFRETDVGKVHISAYDTPNVSSGVDVVPGLCSASWAKEKRDTWGADSPLYQSRVLGEFPSTHDSVVVPIEWMIRANEKWHQHDAAGALDRWPVHMGVDVARLGSDSTILAEYVEGVGVRHIERLRKQETMATCGDVVSRAVAIGANSVNVDADGLGAGVYDRLHEIFTGADSSILIQADPSQDRTYKQGMGYADRTHGQDTKYRDTTHKIDTKYEDTTHERDRKYEDSKHEKSDKEHKEGVVASRWAKSSMKSGAYGASSPLVRSVRGGMRPKISDRFFNFRAEMYWTLRERLDPNNENSICLPPDDKLFSQLTSIRWRLNSKGQIRIEGKDEMRTRGMQSPDEADAVVYALSGQETFVDFVLV